MKKLLILLLLNYSVIIFAQPGTIDTSFNPTDTGFDFGANGNIQISCIQPDGKILIGGGFTKYSNIDANHFARLNPNGDLDKSFNSGIGIEGTILSILVQTDGKILIGGDFTSYNGTPIQNLALLNNDGSLDTSFNTVVDGIVKTIIMSPDGKIILGGSFRTINGNSISSIARLNTDWSIDNSFTTDILDETGTQVISIALQVDGKLLISGRYLWNQFTIDQIVRLNIDGSLDTSFEKGSTNAPVNSLAVQSDGKIIIGGSFHFYNGKACYKIGRLNSDGSIDNSFNSGTGTDWPILSLSLRSDGKIYIRGEFHNYNGTEIRSFARLNSDGSLDTSFIKNDYYTYNTMILLPDDKIIVGGYFANGITRLNVDGTTDKTFRYNPFTGADNGVLSIALQSDGKILIGGLFDKYNNTIRNKIARLNTDGSLDASFNPGVGFNNSVRSIVIQPDGKIVVGGIFTTFNTIPRNGIARLNPDGSLDTSFNPGNGLNIDGGIYAVYIETDGKILIGGKFSSYNDSEVNGFARLNSDGSLDSSFNLGGIGFSSESAISTINKQSDGKILIGGAFMSYNSDAISGIARLNFDGSLDSSFSKGFEVDILTKVVSIEIQIDGKILIGGSFFDCGGEGLNNIARLNIDGSLDSSFKAKTDFWVSCMKLQPNGQIIISSSSLARLNTDGSLDTNFIGEPIQIFSIGLQSDGKILIGGYFTNFNGVEGRNRIARIYGDENLGTKALVSDLNSIQVYPNPTENILKISAPIDLFGTEFSIIDFSGKVVRRGIVSQELNIELGDLNKGLYLLKTGNFQPIKFVKK